MQQILQTRGSRAAGRERATGGLSSRRPAGSDPRAIHTRARPTNRYPNARSRAIGSGHARCGPLESSALVPETCSPACRRRDRDCPASAGPTSWARWKSSNIGWPSPASSTFEGLMSRCNKPALMGMMQAFGQARPDPANGLLVRGLRQKADRRATGIGGQAQVALRVLSSACTIRSPLGRCRAELERLQDRTTSSCRRETACTAREDSARETPERETAERYACVANEPATGVRRPCGCVSLTTKGRSESKGWVARKTRPAPPRPNSRSKRNSPNSSPAAGKLCRVGMHQAMAGEDDA